MNSPAVIDDINRDRSEDDMQAVIWQLLNLRQRIKAASKDDAVATFDDVRKIPSRMRMERALNTADGKRAMNMKNIPRQQCISLHNEVAPSLLRCIFNEMANQGGARMMDIGGRLAQALFEINKMPAVSSPLRADIQTLLNTDEIEFNNVARDGAWRYASTRLVELAERGDGIEECLEQYGAKNDVSGFLQVVLGNVDDAFASELLNAVELAGYDVDDPAILDRLKDEYTDISPAP